MLEPLENLCVTWIMNNISGFDLVELYEFAHTRNLQDLSGYIRFFFRCNLRVSKEASLPKLSFFFNIMLDGNCFSRVTLETNPKFKNRICCQNLLKKICGRTGGQARNIRKSTKRGTNE